MVLESHKTDQIEVEVKDMKRALWNILTSNNGDVVYSRNFPGGFAVGEYNTRGLVLKQVI